MCFTLLIRIQSRDMAHGGHAMVECLPTPPGLDAQPSSHVGGDLRIVIFKTGCGFCVCVLCCGVVLCCVLCCGVVFCVVFYVVFCVKYVFGKDPTK